MAKRQGLRPLLWFANLSAIDAKERDSDLRVLAWAWRSRGTRLRFLSGIETFTSRASVESVVKGISHSNLQVLCQVRDGKYAPALMTAMGALDHLVILIKDSPEELVRADLWIRAVAAASGPSQVSMAVKTVTSKTISELRMARLLKESKLFSDLGISSLGVFSHEDQKILLESNRETKSIFSLQEFAKKIDEVTGVESMGSSLSESEEQILVQMPRNQTMSGATSIGEVENESQGRN